MQEARKLLGYGILCCFQKRHCLSAASLPFSKALLTKLEKHALRVSLVIAAVAKVSCEHGLWLVARVNFRALEFPGLRNRAHLEEHPRRGGSHWIVRLSKKENLYAARIKNRKFSCQIPHHPRRNGRRHQPLIPRRCRCQSRRNRRHLRCPARLAIRNSRVIP